jgi:hypothetical protein
MSAPFDRNALKLNVEESKGAWDEMKKLLGAVNGYVDALQSLELKPVPVVSTTIDPFHNLPELRTTLLTAQKNAGGWTSIGQGIFNTVILQILMFGHTLQAATAQIQGIVDAAKARSLTPAERKAVVDQLRSLQSTLNSTTAGIERQRPGIVDFLRVITTDSAPLKSGARDLGKTIPIVQQNITNEAMKYALSPLDRGIYEIIVKMGAKILQSLNALKDVLFPLTQAGDHVLEALQGILTIWQTIQEKFKAVIDVLALTETSVDTFSTLPDLLEIATESWKQLSDYVLQP